MSVYLIVLKFSQPGACAVSFAGQTPSDLVSYQVGLSHADIHCGLDLDSSLDDSNNA